MAGLIVSLLGLGRCTSGSTASSNCWVSTGIPKSVRVLETPTACRGRWNRATAKHGMTERGHHGSQSGHYPMLLLPWENVVAAVPRLLHHQFMTPPIGLQHDGACSTKRVERSEQSDSARQVVVTTWRCLDCAAFASEVTPMAPAMEDGSEEDLEAVVQAALKDLRTRSA